MYIPLNTKKSNSFQAAQQTTRRPIPILDGTASVAFFNSRGVGDRKKKKEGRRRRTKKSYFRHTHREKKN